MDPVLSSSSRYRINADINLFVMQVVNAAITEIRKEEAEQLKDVMMEDAHHRAAQIVAKRLEAEGSELPRATYEGEPRELQPNP